MQQKEIEIYNKFYTEKEEELRVIFDEQNPGPKNGEYWLKWHLFMEPVHEYAMKETKLTMETNEVLRE